MESYGYREQQEDWGGNYAERYWEQPPEPGSPPAPYRPPAVPAHDPGHPPPPDPGPVDGPGPVGGPGPAGGHGPLGGPGPAAAPPPGVGGRRPPAPAAEGLYRARRPAAAVLLWIGAGILELPALVLLVDAAAAEPVSASGVIAAACLMAALPLLAVGLYAVITGAVRAAGPNSVQAWLRPPVAYLSVGLVLVVAAGLAA